jgi:hypothetical protein
LRAVGAARTILSVGVQDKPAPVGKTVAHVTDAYVPIGARVLHVDNAAGLSVGMPVIVQRPETASWICAIGMDQIPQRKDGHPISQWQPGPGLQFERTLTAIDNNQITIDAPLTNALELSYEQSTIWPYALKSRIAQVGIENLHASAAFSDAMQSYFSSLFIDIQSLENGWVSNVAADGFANGLVTVGGGSRWITVENSALSAPIIPPAADPPAGFTVSGQEILVKGCSVNAPGVRIHPLVTQAAVAGPNVVIDFVAAADTGPYDIGGHQRWATGMLFDRVKLTDLKGAPAGNISMQNRGNEGSGQGWSLVNSVAWNSTAATFTLDSPPTAQNWAIGGSATRLLGAGYFTNIGMMVQPSSLFLAQLQARLGAAAVKAIGY